MVKSKDAQIQPIPGTKSIVIFDLPVDDEPHLGNRDNFIIVRPFYKGEVKVQYPIKLSQVSTLNFNTELQNLGLSKQRTTDLRVKSGKSIPALRRLLSNEPKLRQKWSGTKEKALELIPFILTGSWVNTERYDDFTILELLGNSDKNEIQKRQDYYLEFEDSPLQKYGNVIIVKSQFDSLISAGFALNKEHLNRFLDLVNLILVERDPILDLPEDKWYLKNILKKERSYSDSAITGICESLCILANYEDSICDDDTRFFISKEIDKLVNSILENADSERWLSIQKYLTYLAEASPEMFLINIENDLDKENPAIKVLMRSIDDNYMGYCLRTHLLWGLEMLAWHEQYFTRVVKILFRLQPLEVKDSWSNSSHETAKNLFRVWLPSTEVSIQKRFDILRKLFPEFRIPVLEICLSLLPKRQPQYGEKTALPKWNSLDKDVPNPSHKEVLDSYETSRDFLIKLAPYNTEELKRVLEVISDLELKQIKDLEKEVKRWTKTATDIEKIEVMNSLRNRTRYLKHVEEENKSKIWKAVDNIKKSLQTNLPSLRHRWLFTDKFIDWSSIFDNSVNEHPSFKEIEAKIAEHRQNAVNEILKKQGQKDLLDFIFEINCPELVAQIILPTGVSSENRASWLIKVISQEKTDLAKRFIQGSLFDLNQVEVNETIKILDGKGILKVPQKRNIIVESLPANKVGWNTAKELGKDAEFNYWTTINIPGWSDAGIKEIEYAVKKQISVGRPNSAFFTAEQHIDKLPTKLLMTLLSSLVQENNDKWPRPDSYIIEKAFELLDKDQAITDEQIAEIEWPFLPILVDFGLNVSKRITAWHRLITKDPKHLKAPLIRRYKRDDGVEEPSFETISKKVIQNNSDVAFHLFSSWPILPGESKKWKIK